MGSPLIPSIQVLVFIVIHSFHSLGRRFSVSVHSFCAHPDIKPYSHPNLPDISFISHLALFNARSRFSFPKSFPVFFASLSHPLMYAAEAFPDVILFNITQFTEHTVKWVRRLWRNNRLHSRTSSICSNVLGGIRYSSL